MAGKKLGNWRTKGFFGLHYDLHAAAEDTRLGAELTPQHLRRQLEKVKPDFVQCDCKGIPGYASYPTKIGYPAPGIVRDALRVYRDVTREMGIPLSVHYSGLWDVRAVEMHPEWSALDPAGKLVVPRPGYEYGFICRLGPYVDDLMIPQLLEIIAEYDVDGFWVDCDNWAVVDCYCSRCRAEFKRRTGISEPPVQRDHPDWPAWRAFQRDTFTEYVSKYTAAIHERKPGCAVCSNWLYSIRQPGPVTIPVDYLSGDFTPSFGCDRAGLEGRYIDGHRMPWNLMAWTFTRQKEEVPFQTKTANHLCQETAEVMSCGGAVFLYDQPQRSGWTTEWHQDIFADVADFCRKRQPFCQNSESAPEVAILLSSSHFWKNNTEAFCLGESQVGIEGALNLLLENQYHVDILDETRLLKRIREYALVVVAEQNPISSEVVSALESYAGSGGIVLITGSHLAETCAGLVGVEAVGPMENTSWNLPVRGEAATLAGPWRPVKVVDAEVYASVMKEQQPDKDETLYPGATIRRVKKGKIVGIHGDLMRNYYFTHHPRIAYFLADLLNSLDIKRRLIVSGPPSLEVSLRKRGSSFMVHLVNRSANPTLTYNRHFVEEIPPIGPVLVKLRLDKKPDQVTLEPGHRKVDWFYTRKWLEVRVGAVVIHEILAIS